MKIYKVYVCLALVRSKIRHYDIKAYNCENTIMFVEASDPDDACYKAIHEIARNIINKDHSMSTLIFVKDLLYDIKVVKVISP